MINAKDPINKTNPKLIKNTPRNGYDPDVEKNFTTVAIIRTIPINAPRIIVLVCTFVIIFQIATGNAIMPIKRASKYNLMNVPIPLTNFTAGEFTLSAAQSLILSPTVDWRIELSILSPTLFNDSATR